MESSSYEKLKLDKQRSEENPIAFQHERSWEEQSVVGWGADVLGLDHIEKTLHMEAYSICKYLCCGADMSLMRDWNDSHYILFEMAVSVLVVSFSMVSVTLDPDF